MAEAVRSDLFGMLPKPWVFIFVALDARLTVLNLVSGHCCQYLAAFMLCHNHGCFLLMLECSSAASSLLILHAELNYRARNLILMRDLLVKLNVKSKKRK